MNYKIEEIQGIGTSYAQKLAKAGINDTETLLTKCSTPTGRRQISQKTDVSENFLLKWTNLADLMRVSGVGPQFSELLEAAGVDTVTELGHRNADNLAATIETINEEMNLAKTVPAATTVAGWVNAAKDMKPKITY